MTTHDTSHPPVTGRRSGSPPTARRRADDLTVAWWAVGAVVAVIAAVTDRTALAAVATDQGMLNAGVLRTVPLDALTTGVAVLAVLGAGLSAWLRWGPARPAARAATVTAAVVVLAGAVLLVDATVLAGLGYLPALLIMSLFSAEVRGRMDAYVAPDMLFQGAVLVGAVLLAVTTVRYARRAAAACERCGRRHDGADPAWTTPAAAARWGRVATWVAAVIPVLYAVTRLAWAVGIPLGFDSAMVGQMRGTDLIGPVGLGGFALLGGVLTLGLSQRWGEVFPRWMLGLAGRRVPVGLAVVPATVVAVVVLPAGLSMIAMTTSGVGQLTDDLAANWGAVGPGFLWPLWSVALGAATYAYWLRRRGTCRTCGRG